MRTVKHPSREALEAFLAGTLPSDESRAVVRHLLSGCVECRRLSAELWPPGGAAPTPEDAFGRAFAGVAETIRQREASLVSDRALAVSLEEELLRHPPGRQRLLALNSRRYHNWYLCESLLKRSFESGFDSPRRALDLAEVGLLLATRLSPERYGAALVHDLQARAWALFGNGKRLNGDPRAADEAFRESRFHLEQGSSDPLEEATVSTLEASLRHSQRRFDEARRLLDRATGIYRRVGDEHLVGRTLIDKSRTFGETGDHDREIELLRHGLSLLDATRDPRMALAARHNMAVSLQERGDLEHALDILKEIVPRHAQQGEAMSLLRLRWLEGKLAHAQGRYQSAEEAFREVRDGFLERGAALDAAQAALDLAEVYLQQDRLPELKALANDLVPIFRALEVPRETLAALTLFREAVRRERITLRWIADLASYLDKAKLRPELEFRPD